jgi:hypothetical protein
VIGRERAVDEGPMAGVSHQDWQGLWVADGGSEDGKNIAVLQEIAPGGGQASQMAEARRAQARCPC